MKKKSLLGFGIAALAVIIVAFCGAGFFSGFGRTYYYTQIDNSKLRQVSPTGVVDLSGNGGMDHSYTLTAYDENGREKDLTFGVSRELRESAFLRLTVSPVRGVLDWGEVQYAELPPAVQGHYGAPEAG